VDVDSFKAINDRLGHDGGDAALVKVAERLCEHFRGRGIVGRVGGDEFAFLVIAKAKEGADAESLRVTAALAGMSVGPMAGGGPVLPLTTSIGMLWLGVPTAEQTPEVALKSADAVMHDARRNRAAGLAGGDAAAAPNQPPQAQPA
jgi:diguanylate cyclase (GGDEF)-like protein